MCGRIIAVRLSHIHGFISREKLWGESCASSRLCTFILMPYPVAMDIFPSHTSTSGGFVLDRNSTVLPWRTPPACPRCCCCRCYSCRWHSLVVPVCRWCWWRECLQACLKLPDRLVTALVNAMPLSLQAGVLRLSACNASTPSQRWKRVGEPAVACNVQNDLGFREG